MNLARIVVLAGHYGSGKTNIALNIALHQRKKHENVMIADIDIVNPYFRTKDSEAMLEEAGVRLITSLYAGSNVDVPALPGDVYAAFAKEDAYAVFDVGGDDRGALALGRYAEMITRADYEMLLVVNRYRYLTQRPDDAVAIAREIEAAAGVSFTGVVNNANLGAETTPDRIIRSIAYAADVAGQMAIPVRMTTVREELYDAVKDAVVHPFPIRIYAKEQWIL